VIGLYELLDPTTYLIEPPGPPSEESTECFPSLNSDTGSFHSENNSLVLMDKIQVSNDIFLDYSDFHSNICESLESCYQEKSKKKKKKKKRIDTRMINLI